MNTKQIKFVPLTNDLLFKDTFGLNVKFLEYLLESYYDYSNGFLKNKLEVYYGSPLKKSKYSDKNFRSDLKVIINREIICNIEMYTSFYLESLQKSKSYIIRIYSTQLEIGDDYSEIKKVTQINFINNINSDIKVMIDEEIKSTEFVGNKSLSFDFNFDFVRLDIAKKVIYNENDRFMNLLAFLSAEDAETRENIAKGDDTLMEINEWINNYMKDDEWWRTYNDDYWNKKIYHEDGKNEGKTEEKIAIAKKLITKNTPLSDIAEITELSIKEIKNLQIKTKKDCH